MPAEEPDPKPGENASQYLARLIAAKKAEGGANTDDRPRATLQLSDVRWAARSGAISGMLSVVGFGALIVTVLGVATMAALWLCGIPRP